ncbi:MAG: transposase [Patescibacteria group bacterium]
MINQQPTRNRKLNRLKGYDYSQNGFYFITICTKNREHFFGKIINYEIHLSDMGNNAEKCWQEIPVHFPDVILDAHIIMPNHIHGIIIIENTNNDVGNKNDNDIVGNKNDNDIVGNKNDNDIVGNKNFCSLRYNTQSWQTKWARTLSSIVRGLKIGVKNCCGENNTIWNKNFCFQQFAWQKSYYDHIIRNEKSLDKIRRYIYNNPAKWELDRNNSENLWM